MSGLMGLMQPGPTLYEADNLRKQRGSQGLLGAIGEPLSYAPGPLGMVGSGLLGAQYLTGEKPMDEGLSGMAMLTALLQGTKVAPIVRAAVAYHGTPRKEKFDRFDVNAEKTTGGGFNKYGVSLTPSEKVAERYATDFSPDSSGRVYKVDTTHKNSLDVSSKDFETLQSILGKIDRGEHLTESQDIGLELIMKRIGVPFSGGNPISAIKSAGYEAINKVPSNSFVEPETLVFDPESIKILSSRVHSLLGR